MDAIKHLLLFLEDGASTLFQSVGSYLLDYADTQYRR
jgi:hypothetical protein